MASKRERARQRQTLLDDPTTPPYIKAELLKEDRLDGRRRRTTKPVSPAQASADFNAELKAWLAEYVVPNYGKPGATADALWEAWETERKTWPQMRVTGALDGSVHTDFRGRPMMLADGSRALLNTLSDQVWQATSMFTLWWLSAKFPDLVKAEGAFEGLPVGHGFVNPFSHPDTCRWGTDRVEP